MPAGMLIVQSQALQSSAGSQMAALATLGTQDKQTIVALIDDTIKNKSNTLTGALQNVVTQMRNEYAATNDPAKQKVIWANLQNALQIRDLAPGIVSQAVVAPFQNNPSGVALSADQMANAIIDLAEANETYDYQPAQISRPAGGS
jgi:hypothetical protein